VYGGVVLATLCSAPELFVHVIVVPAETFREGGTNPPDLIEIEPVEVVVSIT